MKLCRWAWRTAVVVACAWLFTASPVAQAAPLQAVSAAERDAEQTLNRFIARFAARGRDATVADVERWLAGDVPPAAAAKAHGWLGMLARPAKQVASARQHLEAAVRLGAGSLPARRARLDLADLDLEAGARLRAARAYRSLADEPDPWLRQMVTQRLELARTLWRRFVAFVIGAGVLVGFLVQVALRLRRRPRGFWPLPVEVRFFVPVAAVLLGACVGRDSAVLRTLAVMAVLGVVLLYANAVALQSSPPTKRAGRLGYALHVALCGASAIYVAAYVTDLLPILQDTIQMGTEG